MSRNLFAKNVFLGFLSWLIPFAVSLLFFKPGGELIVPYPIFKTTIMVVGVSSGCFLLYRSFSSVGHHFIRNGLVVGIGWFAFNIVLDAVVLIPMMKTNFADYFPSIGLGYISTPVISTAMGFLLARFGRERDKERLRNSVA